MRRLLAAVLVIAGLSACGSTVPLSREQGSATAVGADAALGGVTGAGSGLGATTVTPTQTEGSGQAAPPGDRPASDATAASNGDSGTAADGGTSPVVVSGTANQKPISVGVLTVNNDAAASAGVNNGSTFTPRKAFEGLIASYNARGGIAGRKVQPVYAEIKSSSGNFATDLQAACTLFTQDNHVEVVLSVLGLYDDGFPACLKRKNTPFISGDYTFGDNGSQNAAPGMIAPAALTVDARMSALLKRFTAERRLTKASKLGVIVEGCPYNIRAYRSTVAPLAKQLGVQVADMEQTRCFAGISDLGGQASELQSAILRLRSNGVTDVTFVSGSFESNLFLLFTASAQSQGYHPRYVLTSGVLPVLQEPNDPKPQLANAAGLGWLPATDTDKPAVSSSQSACIADLRKGGGVSPAGGADKLFAYGACDTLGLLDRVLRQSNGYTQNLVAAVHSLGRSFSATTVVNGATDFSGTRTTGPAAGRVFTWVASCSCFGYAGSSFPINS